ncbi:MAG TPA: hypothetical protein EYQ74_04740 [Planctomycetes bacterium]|nr:hypothetical protein [Planctomycetota bacterium]
MGCKFLLGGLVPALAGLISRYLELRQANILFTSSNGRVAPEELANALSVADRSLLIGLAVSAGVFLAFFVVAMRTRERRSTDRVIGATIVLAFGFMAWGTWSFMNLNSRMAHDLAGAIADTTQLTEAEIAGVYEGANARHAAIYADDRPVHASTQLAGISESLQPGFANAQRARHAGAWLGLFSLLAALAALRGGSAGSAGSAGGAPPTPVESQSLDTARQRSQGKAPRLRS